MTEADEIADNMVNKLTVAELMRIKQCQGITPLEFVKSQMQGESYGVIDAVHVAFSRRLHHI